VRDCLCVSCRGVHPYKVAWIVIYISVPVALVLLLLPLVALAPYL
jgi:hypothetical protein